MLVVDGGGTGGVEVWEMIEWGVRRRRRLGKTLISFTSSGVDSGVDVALIIIIQTNGVSILSCLWERLLELEFDSASMIFLVREG